MAIPMRPFGGHHFGDAEDQTAVEALRYAMSLPVAVTISGMESMATLQQNLEVARGFQPMSAGDAELARSRPPRRVRRPLTSSELPV